MTRLLAWPRSSQLAGCGEYLRSIAVLMWPIISSMAANPALDSGFLATDPHVFLQRRHWPGRIDWFVSPAERESVTLVQTSPGTDSFHSSIGLMGMIRNGDVDIEGRAEASLFKVGKGLYDRESLG